MMLKEPENLGQFRYAYKIKSPTNENETKTDLLHIILKKFICIFSLISIIIEI